MSTAAKVQTAIGTVDPKPRIAGETRLLERGMMEDTRDECQVQSRISYLNRNADQICKAWERILPVVIDVDALGVRVGVSSPWPEVLLKKIARQVFAGFDCLAIEMDAKTGVWWAHFKLIPASFRFPQAPPQRTTLLATPSCLCAHPKHKGYKSILPALM